ncbi:hypothetical protein EXN61_14755 [Agrobacterium tumefaciens]|uniref:Uncharacterized protein n=1 Tax=Agrobacterium tumefaciens TaxID=358 RepID=A0A546Y097_AGRTU|nr:hypothetical protein [Agrobacterium tumefaciens]TRB06427.1 hypothetical protein EXN61_14755 [Agrobacterium tumefaciens]
MSISSINTTALLILQRAVPANNASPADAAETDIVKIANGVSSQPSQGLKSGESVAAKFATDMAPSAGKIVIGGLGSADSWGEMIELVKTHKELSNSEKTAWLEKINEFQSLEASFAAFKTGEFYQSVMSGEFGEHLAAIKADALANGPSQAEMSKQFKAMDALLIASGRTSLSDSFKASF